MLTKLLTPVQKEYKFDINDDLKVWYGKVCWLPFAPEPCHARSWITNDHWSWILTSIHTQCMKVSILQTYKINAGRSRHLFSRFDAVRQLLGPMQHRQHRLWSIDSQEN